jgi:hypothetical protein
MIKWIVAEPNPDLHRFWLARAEGLDIEVRAADMSALLKADDLDCVVMPSWVHERLGGIPKLGTSSVLRNFAGLIGNTRWVVTTPTFLESPDDGSEIDSPRWPFAARDQGWETFRRVLDAINAHNHKVNADQIKIIGFDPTFLGFNEDYEAEAVGVVDALKL